MSDADDTKLSGAGDKTWKRCHPEGSGQAEEVRSGLMIT